MRRSPVSFPRSCKLLPRPGDFHEPANRRSNGGQRLEPVLVGPAPHLVRTTNQRNRRVYELLSVSVQKRILTSLFAPAQWAAENVACGTLRPTLAVGTMPPHNGRHTPMCCSSHAPGCSGVLATTPVYGGLPSPPAFLVWGVPLMGWAGRRRTDLEVRSTGDVSRGGILRFVRQVPVCRASGLEVPT
jgi:hypothetical protein